MKLRTNNQLKKSLALSSCLLIASFSFYNNSFANDIEIESRVNTISKQSIVSLHSAVNINPTTVELILSDGNRRTIDFYGENVFRMFQDNHGGIVREPKAKPEAKILVNTPRKKVNKLSVTDEAEFISIITDSLLLRIKKSDVTLTVTNLHNNRTVLQEIRPAEFTNMGVKLYFREGENEYYYGGGVQNGRFSHKGKIISIENQNSWTDGGVASPTPYYWSTAGYGIMWHTFKKGQYDFGATTKGEVKLSHEENYLDTFFMFSTTPVGLLNDFYQLTGNPVLIPKFGFYQGHLNAYNRDYWKEDTKGIMFEDGKRYKESQKDNGGIKESLNGERGNYQFSARAVIDRYNKYDMPLGWILPNDGYGAGYGQTETLEGNIANLKLFGDYARSKGVEIGLWTQSDLHPKEGISPLLQRDIVKEVRDAGVRVLKTDVAWVGAGYSFGLNGVADVAQLTPYYGNNARPFIISLDGWAGTQRYAGIWTGDQTGGEWEYIRFHIPTYIGSGLSGQPNISSDMDGIFGGRNEAVNIRDFQWKTFTPMQLNMDGWGSNEKYPHALGERATEINRIYLKLKSELLPYAYTYAHQAIDGMPLIRAMFLSEPNKYTYSTATKYQFMYGDDFLVAPIYQNTAADSEGNDIRNNIYLPKGVWIDYITGEKYDGGKIINNISCPIWKLPVFVRSGAIIPKVNPNNNPKEIDNSLRIYELYPDGESAFTEYDDDGLTESYKLGQFSKTYITSKLSKNNQLLICIQPTRGLYTNMKTDKKTHLVVNTTVRPKKVKAKINGKSVKLKEVNSLDELSSSDNAFLYLEKPLLNAYSKIVKIAPQLHIKLQSVNTLETTIDVYVDKCEYNPFNSLSIKEGKIESPTDFSVKPEDITAYTIKPTWKQTSNTDYCEIEFQGMIYSTITQGELLLDELIPQTDYTIKLRAVNKSGKSDWKEISVRTKNNPFEYAIKDIQATSTALAQGGSTVGRMFDFAEKGDIWHTIYGKNSVPFEVIADLRAVNVLDKFHYLPRLDAGNGTILQAKVYYSLDRNNWTLAGEVNWKRNSDVKEFKFEGNPSARYIRLDVTQAVGGYGSGRELYVFKLPNTETYIQGDINNDKKIDQNDLTSYMNYTGLRRGDSDFEGYISKGDINGNGSIDVYDISIVATQLDEAVPHDANELPEGIIEAKPSKTNLSEGEEFYLTVSAKDIKSLNGIGFALPYKTSEYKYLGVETLAVSSMENLTYDRLHSDGEKVLYPTFVNLGNKSTINGNVELFKIKLQSLKKQKFNLKGVNGMVVSKSLQTLLF